MTGRREQKKQATREALSAAALRLALDQGVANVRVEEIADSAGVAPRTYNNYFASREQAVAAAIAAERALRVGAALRGRPDGEELAAAVTAAVVTQYVDHEPDQRVLALLAGSDAIRAEYLDAVAGFAQPLTAALADRAGTDPADIAPEVLAAAVAAACRVAVSRWLDHTPRGGGLVAVTGRPLEELLREALAPLEPALTRWAGTSGTAS
ncbi:TetR/AcrR family transcriptional regulator [Pseudonocardia ailaonensis]|uniref:TetR/AcrR family transcriptional regulator n=1 Tax=Pseudonocardia ailaonensis TaxID=367279 RepID=A0ABN2NBT8_9PSEU